MALAQGSPTIATDVRLYVISVPHTYATPQSSVYYGGTASLAEHTIPRRHMKSRCRLAVVRWFLTEQLEVQDR